MRFLSWISERDYPIESFKVALDRSQMIKDFIFSIIEGAVIIGALQYAFSKTLSPFIWVIAALAYCALVLYIIGHARYFAHFLMARIPFAVKHRSASLVIAFYFVLSCSFGAVRLLSNMTNEFITSSVMIDTGGTQN